MRISDLLSYVTQVSLGILATSATLLMGQTANAATINFSYLGVEPGAFRPINSIGSGSGSFSFADGLTNITQSDLTTFSFTLLFTEFVSLSTGSSRTYNYGLSTLTAFSATLGSSSLLTSLALGTIGITDTLSTPTSAGTPYSFFVESLQTGGAYVSIGNSGGSFPPFIPARGTVTQVANVPEPSAVLGILLFGGCLGAVRLRRCRVLN
jgi:hypothetical protein